MVFKIDVLLPYSWTRDNLYSYKFDEYLHPGICVVVPIRDQKSYGIVMNCSSYEECKKNHNQIDSSDLKDILDVHEKLCEKTLDWMNKASLYTLIPLNQLAKMMLISIKNRKPGYVNLKASIELCVESKKNVQESKVTECLQKPTVKEAGLYPLAMLNMHWNKAKKMIKNQEIDIVEFPAPQSHDKVCFTEDQLEAIECLMQLAKNDDQINDTENSTKKINHLTSHDSKELENDAKSREQNCYVSLLQGETGSGKTDVYFELIEKVWLSGKQTLILVPEIALANQLALRFFKRFGVHPYTWHNGSKQPMWDWAINGKPGVVIGVRSALWLPFTNLGLIIVDEEHSNTYKQESGARYNAKDIAILRATSGQFPIVLVSATPSLETIYNVQNGKYRHIKLLRTIQHKQDVKIVPITRSGSKHLPQWMSLELYDQIVATLQKKEQVMLFLNRKGFATHIFCQHCHNRLECLHCSAGLSFSNKNYTQCSYCGQKRALPKQCPHCEKEASWQFFGVGIERIYAHIQQMFPDKKITLLSSDHNDDMDRVMEEMANHEIDILIGTQIIAQGLHFPNLTLVGIIQGDVTNSIDIRNSEKMYQIMMQVKGRCGRGEKPGTVIIQTFDHTNAIFKHILSDNSDAWVAHELKMRDVRSLPPFKRMIRIIFASNSSENVENFVSKLALPKIQGVDILGPAPAELYKHKNQYRWSYLVLYDRKIFPQHTLQNWIKKMTLPKNIQLIIDVDPQSFY